MQHLKSPSRDLYRLRAQELRVEAMKAAGAENRHLLLQIADAYESLVLHLAQRVAAREARTPGRSLR